MRAGHVHTDACFIVVVVHFLTGPDRIFIVVDKDHDLISTAIFGIVKEPFLVYAHVKGQGAVLPVGVKGQRAPGFIAVKIAALDEPAKPVLVEDAFGVAAATAIEDGEVGIMGVCCPLAQIIVLPRGMGLGDIVAGKFVEILNLRVVGRGVRRRRRRRRGRNQDGKRF